MKSARSNGKIVIDDGAMKALLEHRSLLPVGIKFAEGTFEPGEVVDIECAGTLVAKGCPDYGSEDINRVSGMGSDVAKDGVGPEMKHKDIILSENIALTR